MVNDPLTEIRTRNPRTAQTVRDSPTQVQNLAGGFVFGVDDVTRLDRFLIMGSEGSYYASAKKMTLDNAQVLVRMADSNPVLVVRRILDISTNGRAAKQDYAIFALAVVAGLADVEGKRAAFAALPRVARTGSTLFMFMKYLTQFRSLSGKMARRAGQAWFNDRPAEKLSYQMVKYRSRNGWSTRDALRVFHPKASSMEHNALYAWATKGTVTNVLPSQVRGFVDLQAAKSDVQAAAIIREHNLPWETVPDAFMNSIPVWEALLDANMGTTALIRMLSRLTNLGMLGKGKGTRVNQVVGQLTDPATLRTARIHPINVLVALKTYAQGHSVDGKGRWTPERKIIDALDEAFYASFRTVEPTGKRILLAVDCSGSMGYERISGMPLTPREAAAAVALSIAKVEKNYDIVGFTAGRGHGRGYATYQDISDSNGLTELTLSPRQRMEDALRVLNRADFGATDCALPFTWALEKKAYYDAVLVLTDNETWAGPIKVDQALRDYRAQINPQARFMALAFTATGYSVADENDRLSLNISGLDSAVPTLVTNFIRGEF
jgi:60 kDa SS-A/Ro ribonucleoprotein